MNDAYLNLIHSNRVARRTREVLLSRILGGINACVSSQFLESASFKLLEAVINRLIPQDDEGDRVEIASIIASQRANESGDGWRFAEMPPDHIAIDAGLRALNASSESLYRTSFCSLNPSQQDSLLRQVHRGEIVWTAVDARHWFEDLLAMATEIYVSHPATLARIGFSGIAFLPRWPSLGLNTTQSWEPLPR